jgi:hypothetical protein
LVMASGVAVLATPSVEYRSSAIYRSAGSLLSGST